jgi:hypothetical protein
VVSFSSPGFPSKFDQAVGRGSVHARQLDDGEGHQELLLLSFHATSGFGAYDNCQCYFDSFYQNVLGRGGYPTAVPLVWIVGGDFNCRAGRAIYLPITSTHQSGHVIDGFFADQNGTNFELKQSSAAQTWTGAGQFITNPNANPRGLVINGLPLSDHCPVIAELQSFRFPLTAMQSTQPILSRLNGSGENPPEWISTNFRSTGGEVTTDYGDFEGRFR